MAIQTTLSNPLKLEQLIPEDPPHTVLPKNVGRTMRIRLTRDVWPTTKLTKGDRLYGGQVEVFPEKEARALVENRCGELMFDQPDDEEAPPEAYGKIIK
jgi:hypothetical protein